MKKIYNKLVRDKIPEIIVANRQKPITKTLNNKEYLKELIKKLEEETDEFIANPLIEELADIVEVLIAIRIAIGASPSELEEVRRKKTATNGRFKKRIFLESVED